MAEGKTRHGCLTAFLILMIVANSLTAVMYLLRGDAIHKLFPNMPGFALPLLIVLALVNIVCAIALFKWKKWGFWGFGATSVIALIMNLALGLGLGRAFGGIIGLAILYGVLQIGKENKGWPQLD